MIGLECKLYGHHWVSTHTSEDQISWFDRLRCEGCGGVRVDKVSKTSGRTKKRTYTYPDGYLNTKGAINKDRATLKKETLQNGR